MDLALGGVLVLDGVLVLVRDGVQGFCGDFVLVFDGVLPLFWGRTESAIFPFAFLGSIMVVIV